MAQTNQESGCCPLFAARYLITVRAIFFWSVGTVGQWAPLVSGHRGRNYISSGLWRRTFNAKLPV
jgi:hypothetical protein